MATIRKDDAQGRLGPYHDGLRACVVAAWDHWLRTMGEFPGASRRGRRTILHEYIVAEVRTRYGDVPGVKIRELKSGRFLIVVEGLVLLFKHVDSALRPSNYPTKTAIAFNQQMPLPEVPRGSRLIIGYQLNEFETALSGIHVIMMLDTTVNWSYELGKEGGEVLDMFRPDGRPKEPRVRQKQQPKRLKKIVDGEGKPDNAK